MDLDTQEHMARGLGHGCASSVSTHPRMVLAGTVISSRHKGTHALGPWSCCVAVARAVERRALWAQGPSPPGTPTFLR